MMYETANLVVALGGRTILHGIDISVAKGSATVVIGPNGAGKSTLLRALAGERRRKSGSVRIDGTDISEMSARNLAARRAVLTQSVAMAFPFPVDNVLRLGVPPTVTRADADRHVARAMEAVDLDPGFVDRPITTLSGGEQQRVHMARVLVQLWTHTPSGPPGYLLLDEPTAHLDPTHQAQIVRLARNHVRDGGGVLAVLHDLNLAAAIGDLVVVLDAGRIVACGAPSEVLTPEILEPIYKVGFQVRQDAGSRWIVQDFSTA